MKSAHGPQSLTGDPMRLHALSSTGIFISLPQLFSLHRRFLLLGISVSKSLALTLLVKTSLDTASFSQNRVLSSQTALVPIVHSKAALGLTINNLFSHF